jgi:glyoxylate/hydroxypyruvate reductase A
LAILFVSAVDRIELWRPALEVALPGLELRVHPAIGDPRDIDCAIVWSPPRGLLASLPNLKLIASLGAGVDHLLADPDLPRDVPLVRLSDPDLVVSMRDYVLDAVLRLHRQGLVYAAQQREAVWRAHRQPSPGERRVGILGLGRLGSAVAETLRDHGFRMAGWSRGPKALADIVCFAGEDGFAALLARSEILICLLPLTAETTDCLDAAAFAKLPRGAGLINVGRGRHVVEPDLLAALDVGQLSYAILDVFREEPLPPTHPFWRHPRIVVTPHVAAFTNPETAAPLIAENIRRARDGRPLLDRVDPARGY